MVTVKEITEINCGVKIEARPSIRRELTLETIFVGQALDGLKRLVRDFAKEGLPLLFVGERGTGKEVLAKIYTEVSGREQHSFNCAGISENTALSALFGHVKGSYTDAKNNRKGLFSTASSGLIFLDELGAATLDFQAKLLRILETGDFQPFGSDNLEKIKDVFICAATSDLSAIRPDLRDRFVTLYIPPLRAHQKDVPGIFRSLWESEEIEDVIFISQAALNLLKKYLWPGNVRELRQTLRIAITLARSDGDKVIMSHHLPVLNDSEDVDYSKEIHISKLKSNGKAMAREAFFHCFGDSDLEGGQFMLSPKAYKDAFYKYHVDNGIDTAVKLHKLFPDTTASTLQGGIGRYKKQK